MVEVQLQMVVVVEMHTTQVVVVVQMEEIH